MAANDAELVGRLVAGDAAALEDAYQRYAARCKSVAYRVLRDDARAEDAVQEAYLALWRHRAGLVVRTAGVGPWLVTVARNAALAMLRAEQRRAAREQRSAHVPPEPEPFDVVASQGDAASVRAALAGLPDEQKTVINCAYFGAMTMAQIAARTGAPLGTVKRRAQLGLARLARALEPQRG